MAAVFGLVFVGVLAWLVQQTPAHDAAAPTVKKRSVETTASGTGHTASRQGTPAPLVASLGASAPGNAPTVRRENTLSQIGSPSPPPVNTPAPAVEQSENARPATLPVATPAFPPISPAREAAVVVRLDSIPPGAQIRLGDEILGVTPCRVRLPAGDHQLIARYQDWPETRQTIHLEGTETRASAEIRLMRPDLVPGLAAQPPTAQDDHARRIVAPAAHRVLNSEAVTPAVRAAPVVAPSSTPFPSAPEVRPAQRVLTPFRIDDPPPSTPGLRQPFSPDGGGDD